MKKKTHRLLVDRRRQSFYSVVIQNSDR